MRRRRRGGGEEERASMMGLGYGTEEVHVECSRETFRDP
jgi:hypothetical protein